MKRNVYYKECKNKYNVYADVRGIIFNNLRKNNYIGYIKYDNKKKEYYFNPFGLWGISENINKAITEIIKDIRKKEDDK